MFEITHPRSSELHILANVERAAAQLFPAERLPDANATVPHEQLSEGFRHGLLWVARSRLTIVAFALAVQQPPYLHLEEISVHPDFSRRGIGQALVERVKEETVRRGLSGITLTTFADIPWNGPWYGRLQFKTMGLKNLPEHIKQAIDEEVQAGMEQRIGMVWHVSKALS